MIWLTDEQHALARALVEVGRYPSLSAVLQQGVDEKEMDTRLDRMVAGKRRAHGQSS